MGMKNHTYYCRFYVKRNLERILIPMLVRGETEDSVISTISEIISSMNNDPNYRFDGFDEKFLVQNESQVSAILKGDLIRGRYFILNITINSEFKVELLDKIPVFSRGILVTEKQVQKVGVHAIFLAEVSPHRTDWNFPDFTLQKYIAKF